MSTTRFTTSADAIGQVIIPALGDHVDEFDVDGIFYDTFTWTPVHDEEGNELVNRSGFAQTVDGEEFWQVVERYARPAAEVAVGRLNAYDGEDIWGEVIRAQCAYDEELTDLVEGGTSDALALVDGTVIRHDQQADRWGVAGETVWEMTFTATLTDRAETVFHGHPMAGIAGSMAPTDLDEVVEMTIHIDTPTETEAPFWYDPEDERIEEWDPETYTAALRREGWDQVTDWNRATNTCTVRRTRTA